MRCNDQKYNMSADQSYNNTELMVKYIDLTKKQPVFKQGKKE